MDDISKKFDGWVYDPAEMAEILARINELEKDSPFTTEEAP